MGYKILITKRANRLMDNIIHYISYSLRNQTAAGNLLKEIENIYGHLQKNPERYPLLNDSILKSRQYRKAFIPHYNYIIIYKIDSESKYIYIMGVFHVLENYHEKI